MGLKSWEWVLISLIIGILLWFVLLSFSSTEDCLARGGHLIKTGETTFFVKSGNVLIPITNPSYECDP